MSDRKWTKEQREKGNDYYRGSNAHFGDPCIYCRTAHDDVPRGPCKGHELPHASDCAIWVREPCNCVIGKNNPLPRGYFCNHFKSGEPFCKRCNPAMSQPPTPKRGEPSPDGQKADVSKDRVLFDLRSLVRNFSEVLLDKLKASEEKYGWDGGWKKPGWEDDLRRGIRKHIEKGDPRDVAAYCAFAWHHGWSLSNPSPSPEVAAPVEDLSNRQKEMGHVELALRRRIHRIEQHNQYFFRCESCWCNPDRCPHGNQYPEHCSICSRPAVARMETQELPPLNLYPTHARGELMYANKEVEAFREAAHATIKRLQGEVETWKWAVGGKDKQILEYVDLLERLSPKEATFREWLDAHTCEMEGEDDAEALMESAWNAALQSVSPKEGA